MQTLDLYFDFKCPASYLALGPTLSLAEELAVDVRWLPYQTKQSEVPSREAQEDKTQRHFRVRAEYRRHTYLRYAQVQGIDMTFPYPLGESTRALQAAALHQPLPINLLVQGFHAYWVDHVDLDDAAVVERLFPGVSPSSTHASDALSALRAIADEQKVIGAPTYVLGDQVFLGREHLPWIRAQLGA